MKSCLKIAATLAVLALAGCANGEFRGGEVFDAAKRAVGLEKPETTKVETPETNEPPLVAGLGDARVSIPFFRESGRSNVYLAGDGVEISLMRGFITRASGIGTTLQGMFLEEGSFYDGPKPVGETLVTAAAKGETAKRTMDYWRKGRVERDAYLCTLSLSEPGEGSSALVVVDETCERAFGEYSYVNRYWINKKGSVMCSRQVFHPDQPPLQLFGSAKLATTKDLVTGGC